MSSAGVTIVATTPIIEADRRGDTLVLKASSTMGLATLLRCDACGEVCAAGVDEAAARLNLLEDGGRVDEGLDLCDGCVR